VAYVDLKAAFDRVDRNALWLSYPVVAFLLR